MNLGVKVFVTVLAAVLLSLAVVGLAFGIHGATQAELGAIAVAVLAAVASAAVATWFVNRAVSSRLEALESMGRALLVSEEEPTAVSGRSGPFGKLAQLLEDLAEDAESRVASVEAESQQLKAVVGGMSEGVLVTDADGRVAFANPQWRQLFGLTGEIEGASVLELSRQTSLDRMLAATLETNEPQQLELELPASPHRSHSTLILNSAPLEEAGGAVVVAQDVTAFLRLTEIRRDFVANVSHELKTPLSAIRGFAETLADGAKDDPEALTEFLDRILKQCTRLEALLSDLLTLSRLEHAADRGRKAPIDLGELVAEAAEVVADRVVEKRLELAIDARSVRPVEGDAVALERLCVNLLDNAVKYNRAGGEIRVRLYDSGKHVVLEVEDTGIGIPKASVERLFERFYRVDKGRSREEGGTGLGLAIVKHAANLHGGTVEVESELGRGSLFRVQLPAG